MIKNSHLWLGMLLLALQGACSSSSEEGNRTTTPQASQTSSGGDGTSASATPAPITEGQNPQNAAPPAPAAPVTPTTTEPAAPAPAARTVLNDAARRAFQQGIDAARQGQLEPARAAFEQALAADPRAHQAAYNAGVIAERQGQDGPADALYQRSLAIQADYDPAMVARARLLIRQRRLADAVSFAAGMASSHPNSARVRAEYARLLVLNNRANEAIEEGRRILRQDERNVPAKLAVAEGYRSLGRLDLALYIVNDLINGSDPNHPNNGAGVNNAEVQHLRGLLQLEVERNVPAAIVSFRRAVELDPEFAEARNNLGVQFLLAGNYQEAIEQLRAAAALSPSWGKAHLNLGDALRATGQYDQAMAEFQRAQQLEPGMVEVHYNTARLYAEQARGIAGTEVESLQRKVQLLQQAQSAFTRYRDTLGAQYASNARRDDVEAQLTRLPQQIERAQRALQRAQAAARRGAAPAEGTAPATPPAGTPAATPPAGTPPAATPPAGTPPTATPPTATPPATPAPAPAGEPPPPAAPQQPPAPAGTPPQGTQPAPAPTGG